MSSQAITQEDRTCLLTEDKLASRALQGHDLHLTRNSEQLEDIITRGHIIQTPEQDATHSSIKNHGRGYNGSSKSGKKHLEIG